ncbi:hypothetical protein [Paenisporosarcina sp. TG-14]|uniref:hypothetical protein n=1 Tax=Paenisporosarcina sp. TG-14 TaxID=1231057 RepID=UPI0002EFC875|nr:hypothetical protein [Paenisporosarcina sp. TG-14]
MGLYINTGKHPDILKNNGHIVDQNQSFFKRDHLSELLMEQQKTNETLNQSFSELKDLFEKQESKQTSHWKYIQKGISEQKKVNFQHRKVDNHVLEWLKELDAKDSNLQVTLENDLLLKQELMNTMETLSHSNLEVVTELDKVGLANEVLDLKVNEQLDLQKQITQQISKQEDTQKVLLSRLDNQEALTEKILRQIDHFRAILFERTSYLAEKIDTGYNYTTSYFSKLMTGDQSLTHFLLNKKQKENNKDSN